MSIAILISSFYMELYQKVISLLESERIDEVYDIVEKLPQQSPSEYVLKTNYFCLLPIFQGHKLESTCKLLEEILHKYSPTSKNSVCSTNRQNIYKVQRVYLLMTRLNIAKILHIKKSSELRTHLQQIQTEHLGEFYSLKERFDQISQKQQSDFKLYQNFLGQVFEMHSQITKQGERQIYLKALKKIMKYQSEEKSSLEQICLKFKQTKQRRILKTDKENLNIENVKSCEQNSVQSNSVRNKESLKYFPSKKSNQCSQSHQQNVLKQRQINE